MEPDPQNAPLLGDVAREATASMRGYWAQIWRSVLVWTELTETERLYLEGAEDFDRLSGASAETVQVKEVAAKITLRSQDVVDAINNVWGHQERNRNRTIKFRFLTTSQVGVEKGAPFGKRTGGINLWNECRHLGDEPLQHKNTRLLANFLLDEGKLSTQLRAFLAQASDTEIWGKLIAPVEFDTEAEGLETVIQEVKNRLINIGQDKGVPASHAADTAAHLYTWAYETATRDKDRYLTRGDLIRIFDDRTRVSIPNATLARLLETLPGPMAAPTVYRTPIGRSATLFGRPPPLPPRYFVRDAAMKEITARLQIHGTLCLQGGTGTGKSTLAIALTRATAHSWSWVDLRGASGAHLTSIIAQTAAELRTEDGIQNLILDDIDFQNDARSAIEQITIISNILQERSGLLVITCAANPPQRLTLSLRLQSTAIYSVPAFSRDEIEEFLVQRGCPAENVAGWWAAFIEVHTSGHAQLVHARIATLEEQHFPIPQIDGLLTTPPDVVEARAEARQLVATLNPTARELIYRLSLTVQALPRQQILTIANQQPPIAEPGLALDTLIGPWLEILGEGLFRLSPLLRGVGSEVMVLSWTTAMNTSIARSFFSFPAITPRDVSSVLLHAMLGRDWATISHLSVGLLHSDNDTWKALSQTASWFVHVGTGTAERPEAPIGTLFFVRMLQLRLAAAAADAKGFLTIIECVDEELSFDKDNEPLRLARHMFLSQIFLRPETEIPAEKFLGYASEYIALTDELKGVLRELKDSDREQMLLGPDGVPDLAAVAGLHLAERLGKRQKLRKFLELCQKHERSEVRRLFWFVGGNENIARYIFDRVWLEELRSPDPNWEECLQAFGAAYEFGRNYSLPGLAQGAARAIVRIIAENLNDPETALRRSDEMRAEIGASPGQEDIRASTLLDSGHPEQALEIWRELLPRWNATGEFDLQQTYSHRLAAVAAEKLGEWAEAADLLKGARDLCNERTQSPYIAGLWMDEAFARWKSGENDVALLCASIGLAAIDELLPDDLDENAFFLRKRAGHTLMWMTAITSGRQPTGFVEPLPAMCSSTEKLNRAQVKSTPNDIMYLELVEFEQAAKIGHEQFNLNEHRLANSPYGFVRFRFNHIRLGVYLKLLKTDCIVPIIVDWADSNELFRCYYREGGLDGADPLPADAAVPTREQAYDEMLVFGLITALVAVVSRGNMNSTLFEQWSSCIDRCGRELGLAPWLDFIKMLFIDQTLNAAQEVRKQQTFAGQLTASICVAADKATGPSELLTIHSYWVDALPQMPTIAFILDDVEKLVVSGWLQLAEAGFRLTSPMLTAPPLIEACTVDDAGWSKIAKILLSACDAVRSVPTGLRSKLEALLDGQREPLA